jgi:outer membrane receptor for ferrienterochelin and colicins
MIRLLLLLLIITGITYSQSIISGKVKGVEPDGRSIPLPGVNIIWEGTSTGTTSAADGSFSIPAAKESDKLVVSMIGYQSVTATVNSRDFLEIVLKQQSYETGEVEVKEKKSSTTLDYHGVENKSILNEKELFKAACCNLSESFETNASVDVSFTDAVTGAKQIEMLGLSGIYTQTTMENLPYIRGLMSSAGLMFIPGVWMKSINISKGTGSVVDGFESITGSIDVEMQNPADEDGEALYLNFYGDSDKRLEGNLNFRHKVNENLSFITLLHSSRRNNFSDFNDDTFADIPHFETHNVMQRWHLSLPSGWEGQLGFNYIDDQKRGGSSAYNYTNKSNLLNVYGKTGYVFGEEGEKSFGIRWSLNKYKNRSVFGLKNYSGDELTGYINFIYDSQLSGEEHKFRTGTSFLFDDFDEVYQVQNYKRSEKIPGAFFEYTYKPDEIISVTAGIRGDYHNHYKTMVSPRLHIRYSPHADWVIRGAAGRGYRTSSIFSEYGSLLATSREVNIISNHNFGYGLNQEVAWNFGLNILHYFYLGENEATFTVDAYRTQFEQNTLADWDSHPQRVTFTSISNGAYSNTLQVELNSEPFDGFEIRTAYRLVDSKQEINGVMTQRPLNSKHRALLNLAYSTGRDNMESSEMLYDLTVQWLSAKRIPSTGSNPEGFVFPERSPSFAVVNTQVTRAFPMGFDLYIGVENLFNFRQKELIIDPLNPFGQYFDASLVWGPVHGRSVYAGFRYRL